MIEQTTLRGVLRFNELMAPHTSWHIGGLAERYYKPADIDDLALFLRSLPKGEPLTWLGLGSNVLIADEGIQGTVIHTLSMKSVPIVSCSDLFPNIALSEEVIRIVAGVPCAKVAKYCAKNALKGGSFFAGIPGTMGGALAMNAGAFGVETWDTVVQLEVMNAQGERQYRTPADYAVGYRSVKGPADEWFVAGYYKFEKVDERSRAEQVEQIAYLLRMRNETQPIGLWSCGSVFQNPPNHYAARLIEASELKGYKIGGAMVSSKHANFIINTGNATAKDVFQLIQYIMDVIWRDHGVRLQPEVRIIGAF